MPRKECVGPGESKLSGPLPVSNPECAKLEIGNDPLPIRLELC